MRRDPPPPPEPTLALSPPPLPSASLLAPLWVSSRLPPPRRLILILEVQTSSELVRSNLKMASHSRTTPRTLSHAEYQLQVARTSVCIERWALAWQTGRARPPPVSAVFGWASLKIRKQRYPFSNQQNLSCDIRMSNFLKSFDTFPYTPV